MVTAAIEYISGAPYSGHGCVGRFTYEVFDKAACLRHGRLALQVNGAEYINSAACSFTFSVVPNLRRSFMSFAMMQAGI